MYNITSMTCVQTMSILVVNQSVIDTCASVFSVIMALLTFETTGLSRDSIYDQFVCRFWLTKKPLWCMMVTSTYGILLTTLSRYFAVIYPIQYKSVSTVVGFSLYLLSGSEEMKNLGWTSPSGSRS